MDVPLVERRICTQAIQIPVTIDIKDPHSLSPSEDYIEGMVIVSSVKFF
jgi:hypothetical protein